MKKPLKKATIVLWILGGLMLIGAIASIGKDASSVIVGIVGGIVLGLIGFLISRKKEETEDAAPVVERAEQPYASRKYRVAGVTFTTGKNGDVNRQDILRRIFYKEPPYDRYSIVPRKYTYNGEPAIGLYVNGNQFEQIGNVPAEFVQELLPILNKVEKTVLEVYGGGSGRNFGASVFFFFKD